MIENIKIVQLAQALCAASIKHEFWELDPDDKNLPTWETSNQDYWLRLAFAAADAIEQQLPELIRAAFFEIADAHVGNDFVTEVEHHVANGELEEDVVLDWTGLAEAVTTNMIAEGEQP